MKDERFQTREIEVRGSIERRIMYSLDGTRWFSNPTQAEECQRRREQFLAEEARAIKKHSTFMENRPPKKKRKH